MWQTKNPRREKFAVMHFDHGSITCALLMPPARNGARFSLSALRQLPTSGIIDLLFNSRVMYELGCLINPTVYNSREVFTIFSVADASLAQETISASPADDTPLAHRGTTPPHYTHQVLYLYSDEKGVPHRYHACFTEVTLFRYALLALKLNLNLLMLTTAFQATLAFYRWIKRNTFHEQELADDLRSSGGALHTTWSQGAISEILEPGATVSTTVVNNAILGAIAGACIAWEQEHA